MRSRGAFLSGAPARARIGFSLGVFLGVIRWKTGRIFGPFVVHGIWNTMAP